MRKMIVISMLTLDGVMQSPGSPDEDRSGGFQYGGWVAPYGDDVSDKLMQKLMEPSDLLLGRKTFEIWEHYWPRHAQGWPGINEVTKYVLSSTRKDSVWENVVFLNDVKAIEELKNSDGSDIQVWGSAEVVQLLLKHGLADELWLIVYPIVLGKGKKLFADSLRPGAFTLLESTATPGGLVFSHYQQSGNVETGTAGV